MRNIDPNENSSPFPMDTLLSREGNCASNGFLMQDLLRKLGVPAVYAGGWCLPMKDMTIGEVTEQNENGFYMYAGHAWCFVYIDGQWLLYDATTPYYTKGIHDLETLSAKYYVTNIARVTPAYDYPMLIPGHLNVVYDGEKQMAVNGYGVSEWYNFYMTNTAEAYNTENLERDYWYRLWEGEQAPAMESGEIYRGNHWFYQQHLTYGKGALEDYHYYYTYGGTNGFRAQGTIRYMGADPYFLDSNAGVNIRCLEVEPTIRYGCLGIPIGYEGPVLVPSVEGKFEEGTLSYHWKSEDTSVATVDPFQGTVHAWEEGFTTIYYTATNNHSATGTAGSESLEIYVYDPNRKVSYEDQVDHDHTYQRIERAATCEIGGVVMETCSQPDCADSRILSSTPALGHEFTEYVSNNNAAKYLNGTKTARCDRPGCAAVDTLMVHDSRLGQVIGDKTTERGIYQVTTAEVDAILGDESYNALRMEVPAHHGVEIKISDLKKAVAKEMDPVFVLYEEIEVSLYFRWSDLLEQWTGDTAIIRAAECGKDILSEQQKQTVAASDAAMLLEVTITDGNGNLLPFGEGVVRITAPFTVSDGTESEYQVYYLEQDGTAEVTDPVNGVGSFIGAHVENAGIYLIAKNVPENLVKEPPAELELEPELLVILAAAAVVVVVLVVLLLAGKKKKRKKTKGNPESAEG